MEKIFMSLKSLIAIVILVVFSFLFSNCGGDDSEIEEPVIGPSASVVDLALDKQLIRGFGGATVFRPTIPLTDAEMDKLYGTGAGQIGLSILRIRVASDSHGES